ncbi:MAG: Ig-like domain-containing protein, partial [Acidobacteriaceae bacterium]|nr:Ig-like domain-containing protein [Acidobacteriaceae bacterium]
MRRSDAWRTHTFAAIAATVLLCFASAGLVFAQAPTLLSITVTPSNASFAAGTTQQMTATGTFSDGSTDDLTKSVNWNTADNTIATIDGQGLATAVSPGSTAVIATQGVVIGSTNLTVTSATLVSIVVTPANPSIPSHAQQQFTATGTFTDNSTQDVTKTVQWSSSTPNVANIANDPMHKGLATGAAAGTTTITATSDSISGSTTLNVTAVLVSLAVTPPNPSIASGTTQQFTATGTYSDQ